SDRQGGAQPPALPVPPRAPPCEEEGDREDPPGPSPGRPPEGAARAGEGAGGPGRDPRAGRRRCRPGRRAPPRPPPAVENAGLGPSAPSPAESRDCSDVILGLIEHDRGKLNERSFEALTLGRRLAQRLGVPLHAVLVGAEARPLAAPLAAYAVAVAHVV